MSSRTSPRLCLWAYSLLECSTKSRIREMTSTGFSLPFCRSQATDRWLCWAVSVDTSHVSSKGSCSTLCNVWGTAVACSVSGITATQKRPKAQSQKYSLTWTELITSQLITPSLGSIVSEPLMALNSTEMTRGSCLGLDCNVWTLILLVFKELSAKKWLGFA